MASMILMDCSSSSTTATRFLSLSRHRVRDGLLHSRRWMPLRFAPTSPSLLRTTAATSCTPSPSVLTGLLFSLFRIMIDFSREHLSWNLFIRFLLWLGFRVKSFIWCESLRFTSLNLSKIERSVKFWVGDSLCGVKERSGKSPLHNHEGERFQTFLQLTSIPAVSGHSPNFMSNYLHFAGFSSVWILTSFNSCFSITSHLQW